MRRAVSTIYMISILLSNSCSSKSSSSSARPTISSETKLDEADLGELFETFSTVDDLMVLQLTQSPSLIQNEVHYGADGEESLQISKTYTYDSDGRVIEEVVTENRGERVDLYTHRFRFNVKGELEYSETIGVINRQRTYTYNSDGYLTNRVTKDLNKGSMTEVVSDILGEIVEVSTFSTPKDGVREQTGRSVIDLKSRTITSFELTAGTFKRASEVTYGFMALQKNPLLPVVSLQKSSSIDYRSGTAIVHRHTNCELLETRLLSCQNPGTSSIRTTVLQIIVKKGRDLEHFGKDTVSFETVSTVIVDKEDQDKIISEFKADFNSNLQKTRTTTTKESSLISQTHYIYDARSRVIKKTSLDGSYKTYSYLD